MPDTIPTLPAWAFIVPVVLWYIAAAALVRRISAAELGAPARVAVWLASPLVLPYRGLVWLLTPRDGVLSGPDRNVVLVETACCRAVAAVLRERDASCHSAWVEATREGCAKALSAHPFPRAEFLRQRIREDVEAALEEHDPVPGLLHPDCLDELRRITAREIEDALEVYEPPPFELSPAALAQALTGIRAIVAQEIAAALTPAAVRQREVRAAYDAPRRGSITPGPLADGGP
jgi:hypothetical protein